MDQVAADKAGAAGDEDHRVCSGAIGAVAAPVSLRRMSVVEKPSTVGHNFDAAPGGEHLQMADDGLHGVIAALDEHVGFERA